MKFVYTLLLLQLVQPTDQSINQDSSKPLFDLIAYNSFSSSILSDSYLGNFNKFMHVAADGKRGDSLTSASAPYYLKACGKIKIRSIA